MLLLAQKTRDLLCQQPARARDTLTTSLRCSDKICQGFACSGEPRGSASLRWGRGPTRVPS